MDLRRLEASGDQDGLLRELLRRGLSDQARALVLRMIEGGASWSVEDAEGEALPVISDDERAWLDEEAMSPRWVRVGRLRVPTPWTPQRARLFACACVDTVMPHFESTHIYDTRPRRALEVARELAYGEASERELRRAQRELAQVSHRVGVAALWATQDHPGTAIWAAWVVSQIYASGAPRAWFLSEVLEPLFLRWHLGEVPEFTGER